MSFADKKNIKFSVLIPVYNAEKYLFECIESVLNQTYPAYEIILVNDGSKDRSGSLCDELALKYSFVRAFHKENGGQLSSRQYAVERAKGDFYVFLDSDDTLKPDALKTVYDTILKYDCDCVIYDFERYQNGVSIERDPDRLDSNLVIADKRELSRLVLLNQRYNSMCRKAVKATVFSGKDYSDFYHIRHGEDLLQSVEVLENCNMVVVIPRALYNYRMNDASVTHTIRAETYRIDYMVEEIILEFLNRSGVFQKQDMEDLRDYWITCFVDSFRRIALFDTSFSQKKKFFKEMADSTYFKNFLSCGVTNESRVGLKRHYFKLFCQKRYFLIVILEKMYSVFFNLLKNRSK